MSILSVGKKFCDENESDDLVFEITRLTEKSVFYKVVENGNLEFASRISKKTFWKEMKLIDYS